ncbi:MAG: hypothetical protein E6G47_13360, partial [Actinobacteria bacterium]
MRAPTPFHLPRALAIAAFTLGIAATLVTPASADRTPSVDVGHASAADAPPLPTWPMFHDSVDRLGVQTNEPILNASNVSHLGIKWSAQTGDDIWSSPAVVNGTVYVGSYDHKIYAFDASTGATKWTYATGDAVESSPAIVNGILYVGSDDHYLYALNAASGALVWKAATGDRIAEDSPAVANGIVYIGSYDGNFYAFDANTGVLKWRKDAIWKAWESPAVANGIVYIGT